MNNNNLLILIVAILFLKFALIGLYNIKKECYNSFKKEEKENELFKKNRKNEGLRIMWTLFKIFFYIVVLPIRAMWCLFMSLAGMYK